MTWWAIFALAAGTYVSKAAGPLALGSRTVPPSLQRALTLLSVTLLSGLVAISTFGDGRGLDRRRPRGRAGRRAGRRVAARAVRRRGDRRDRSRPPACGRSAWVEPGINYSEPR